MALAGQVHCCWKCARRLPVDNVQGSCMVVCPRCKSPNQITVRAAIVVLPSMAREQC